MKIDGHPIPGPLEEVGGGLLVLGGLVVGVFVMIGVVIKAFFDWIGEKVNA